MFFKLFIVVIQRSLIRELITTPEVHRKSDIRAATKRNMACAIVKQPQLVNIRTHLLDADYSQYLYMSFNSLSNVFTLIGQRKHRR